MRVFDLWKGDFDKMLFKCGEVLVDFYFYIFDYSEVNVVFESWIVFYYLVYMVMYVDIVDCQMYV